MKRELLADEKCILGEGPLRDQEEEYLYWIDSMGKAVFRVREKGGGLERRS